MDKTLNWGGCSTCYNKGYYYAFENDNEDYPLAHAAKKHYCECYVGVIRKQDEERPIEI